MPLREMNIMTSGGVRNRGGRPPDPDSARSDKRGYSLDFLPPAGYDGRPPEFPLPGSTARERRVWREAWRTPQACAWSLPSEHWRWPTVALWVRTKVRCEELDVTPSLLAQLHRLADQIGMTTAGLREMGWRVGNAPSGSTGPAPAGDETPPDEVGERRERRLRG